VFFCGTKKLLGVNIKKTLILALITALFIEPSMSYARCVVIKDGDLSTIFAKDSSAPTTFFTDITAQNTTYANGRFVTTTFTDITVQNMQNTTWFFWGTPENNSQKNPGSGVFDQAGYLGIRTYITGGPVERSGSITVEYPDLTISSTELECKLTIYLNSVSFNAAHLNTDIELMVSATPDSSKALTLMHMYFGNFSISNITGSLTVTTQNQLK
jgi:hypothetical protein